jgi:NDP-sugar pyrophosphorylase family protein
VRAVVLVGGEGTRLRPLTNTIPKQLLPVVELTMIERVLSQLAAHGVDDAVLSLGYRPDAFLSAFPDDRACEIGLGYAVEPAPLDTAGAIAFAAAHAGIDDTFLVVNGDVLTDLDVTALVRFHHQRGAEASISLTPVEDPSRFGVVPTDDHGRVMAFIEKPAPGTAPTNLINAGAYVLEPSVLDRIDRERRVSIERETFPSMVDEGSLYALASRSYWIDAGTPAQYLQAHRDLLSGARPGPPAPGARQVGSGVWVLGAPLIDGDVRSDSLIGEGAVVAAGACVVDTVVGAGARVDRGASLNGAVLLPGATVAAAATVDSSVIGTEAVVGEQAVVRDLSVVGVGVVLGPGTRVEGDRVPA